MARDQAEYTENFQIRWKAGCSRDTIRSLLRHEGDTEFNASRNLKETAPTIPGGGLAPGAVDAACCYYIYGKRVALGRVARLLEHAL